MNNTSRLVELLGELRRDMNGLVADTMVYYGKRYGMNYGVSLHTVRSVAKKIGIDHAFAKYLFRQEVRELQLASISVIDPACIDSEELEYWAAGLINSELCEEFAQKVLSQIANFDEVFSKWMSGDNELLKYAALRAASRHEVTDANSTIELIRPLDLDTNYIANAVVSLLAHIAENNKDEVVKFLAETNEEIRSEVSWRI